MSLLDLGDLLGLLQRSVGTRLHVLVGGERSANHVGHATTLLIAELLSLSHVAGSESGLDVLDELGKSTLTESGLQSELTLDTHSEHREQQRLDDRHDDTTLEDSTPNIKRSTRGHTAFEVHTCAEPSEEQRECDSSADHDNPECASYSLKALRVLLGGCSFLLCCHNFDEN